MEDKKLKSVLEALIMASSKPVSLERMQSVFPEDAVPDKKNIREILQSLAEDYNKNKSSIELKEVSSGYRFQIRKDYSEWVSKLWEEKPARYSRALLETLALIAYKQPITRGEIEKIRGVSVSTQIMKTLLEREWVTIVGHRDVPGRPAIYASTRQFLDYFNLKSLDELPPLADIKDIDQINGELALPDPEAEVDDVSSNQISESKQQDEAAVNLDVDQESDDAAVAEALTAEQ